MKFRHMLYHMLSKAFSFLGDFDVTTVESHGKNAMAEKPLAGAWEAEAKRTETKRKAAMDPWEDLRCFLCRWFFHGTFPMCR